MLFGLNSEYLQNYLKCLNTLIFGKKIRAASTALFVLVEMRRVELLSKKTMHQASPSADVFKVSFKFLKHQTPSEVAFVNLYG